MTRKDMQVAAGIVAMYAAPSFVIGLLSGGTLLQAIALGCLMGGILLAEWSMRL